MGTDNRRYPRVEVNWPITMITSTGTIDAMAKNVSLEGVFVRCPEVSDLEDTFRLIIKPPEGQIFLATGRKVWSDTFSRDERTFHGIGVSFLYIVDDDRHVLSELITEQLESE